MNSFKFVFVVYLVNGKRTTNLSLRMPKKYITERIPWTPHWTSSNHAGRDGPGKNGVSAAAVIRWRHQWAKDPAALNVGLNLRLW